MPPSPPPHPSEGSPAMALSWEAFHERWFSWLLKLQGFPRSYFRVYLQNAIPLGSEMSQDNQPSLLGCIREGPGPSQAHQNETKGGRSPLSVPERASGSQQHLEGRSWGREGTARVPTAQKTGAWCLKELRLQSKNIHNIYNVDSQGHHEYMNRG